MGRKRTRVEGQEDGQKAPPLTPRQRWEKYRDKRLAQFLSVCKRIGNMGSAGYESTPAEREYMETVLDATFADMKAKLQPRVKKVKGERPAFNWPLSQDTAAQG